MWCRVTITFVLFQGGALDTRTFWMQSETHVNNFKARMNERVANREMVSAEFTVEHLPPPAWVLESWTAQQTKLASS